MSKKRAGGFTLIELLIVILFVGILVAIAMPSYQRYVLRSHRTVAINALLDLGSREARYYSANNVYTNALTGANGLGYASNPAPVPDATTTYYNLSAALNGNSFTLTSTAVGNQVNDVEGGGGAGAGGGGGGGGGAGAGARGW